MENELEHEIQQQQVGPARITVRRSSTAQSERLLSTMAVVVATADEGKDYLEFFMPFVADRLKTWPDRQRVEPHELSKALCDGWGFPSVPAAVSRLLLQRAQKDGLVTNVDREYFPNHELLIGMPDLTEKKQEMLAGLNALAEAVVAYAWEVHGSEWSEARANAALERLTEDFGADLATAKRDGGLRPSPDVDESLAIVYGFARRAVERDPTNFDRLVAMVQGTMIANALYFEDIRKLPNRLKELRVYIDTSPLLRGLGLACPDVVIAAQEMFALMRSFKIPMFAFTHTLDEMTAILEKIAASLKRGTRVPEEQSRLAGRSREAIDAAIQAGMSSGEIMTLVANLEQRLGYLGIRRCETPRHSEAGHIDEERLTATLNDEIQYLSKASLEKDVESLAAVDRLRGATRPRELAHTRALFITSNSRLVRCSRAFFRAAKRDAPIPHCMSDIALTAQLWVVSSERKPDLPRRLLIADCYSALAPSPPLWERWVSHIIKLREREQITEAQLHTLIYHQQAKALLFEVARGNPENVTDTAVAEVLARYEAEVRAPADQAADAAQAAAALAKEEAQATLRAAQEEREQLLSQVETLTAWKQQQQAKDEDAARRRRLARRIGGFIAMLPITVAFAALAANDDIAGRFWWATSITVLVFACASTACWGLQKGWKAPIAVLVSAGALSTLWANVFGVAESPTNHVDHPAGHVHKPRAPTSRPAQ
jgi:hypothetical protein